MMVWHYNELIRQWANQGEDRTKQNEKVTKTGNGVSVNVWLIFPYSFIRVNNFLFVKIRYIIY